MSSELVSFGLGDAEFFLRGITSPEPVFSRFGDSEFVSREETLSELGRFRLGVAVDFGFDSESDLDFKSDGGECDDLDSELEGRLGFDGACDDLDSESEGRIDGVRADLVFDSDRGDGECDDRSLECSDAADFGLDSDGECADLDRTTGASDFIASLDRLTD